MIHEIKIWPQFYQDVVNGEVTTQIRKDDRNYQKDDTIVLRQWEPETKTYTGHSCIVKVTNVFRNVEGITKGYCALSIKLPMSATSFSATIAGKNDEQIKADK